MRKDNAKVTIYRTASAITSLLNNLCLQNKALAAPRPESILLQFGGNVNKQIYASLFIHLVTYYNLLVDLLWGASRTNMLKLCTLVKSGGEKKSILLG